MVPEKSRGFGAPATVVQIRRLNPPGAEWRFWFLSNRWKDTIVQPRKENAFSSV